MTVMGICFWADPCHHRTRVKAEKACEGMRDMKGDQRSSMKGLVFKVNTEGIATVCMYNAVGRGETTVLILSSRHLHHVPSDNNTRSRPSRTLS